MLFPTARAWQLRSTQLQRWRDGISARPAVERALKVLAERRRPEMTKEQKEVLFGATQYAKR